VWSGRKFSPDEFPVRYGFALSGATIRRIGRIKADFHSVSSPRTKERLDRRYELTPNR
jgi:hypothetical protein